MKILFASAYFTYPEVAHGGGTDLLEMIQALSQRHEIHLVSFADPWEVKHVAAMQRFCRSAQVVVPANRWRDKVQSAARMVWRNPLRAPFLLGRRSHREFRQRIAEVVRREKIDVVQFEWAEAAQFVDAVAGTGALAVLDEVDVAFKPLLHEAGLAVDGPERESALRRYEKALQAEIDHCRFFDLILTRSEADAALLRGYLGKQHIEVLRPWTRTSEFAAIEPDSRQPGTLLFVGLMDRKSNVDAVRYFHGQILPRIKELGSQLPADVRLFIVGAEPARVVLKLGSTPGITVTGYVPDLRPYYAACDVFVAPLRVGGGVSNKLIDAMAAGRPVVATRIANEGVGATPGEAILIGDSPDAFAAQVVRLLRDPVLWQRVAQAGRAHVQRAFDWHETVMGLEEQYRRLLESRCLRGCKLEASRWQSPR